MIYKLHICIYILYKLTTFCICAVFVGQKMSRKEIALHVSIEHSTYGIRVGSTESLDNRYFYLGAFTAYLRQREHGSLS